MLDFWNIFWFAITLETQFLCGTDRLQIMSKRTGRKEEISWWLSGFVYKNSILYLVWIGHRLCLSQWHWMSCLDGSQDMSITIRLSWVDGHRICLRFYHSKYCTFVHRFIFTYYAGISTTHLPVLHFNY